MGGSPGQGLGRGGGQLPPLVKSEMMPLGSCPPQAKPGKSWGSCPPKPDLKWRACFGRGSLGLDPS